MPPETLYGLTTGNSWQPWAAPVARQVGLPESDADAAKDQVPITYYTVLKWACRGTSLLSAAACLMLVAGFDDEASESRFGIQHVIQGRK